MSIVFSVIRNKKSNTYLCKSTYTSCYSDVTHETSTDTEWDYLNEVFNNTNRSTALVIFESKVHANNYITENLQMQAEHFEVLSFAEIDAIAEAILLGKDNE